MNHNIISLFSGCGGLDMGFKKAGYHTLLATDVWNVACKSLELNHAADKIICSDIRELDFLKYQNTVDVVIGGPPCPPYSQTRHYLVGKVGGFQDEKAGFAVPECFRAISEIRPKVFLFENVDGFTIKKYKEPMEIGRKKEQLRLVCRIWR